ncbi:MAG TPA: aspartyl/asparaginyl beta-hydroxylase domain-containing protein [Xanthobacteraceae bacterium]|nr:aspartyl/asparaginyl beta-hydroxylase domain-containing protein [Xanthobacteraceae bacterium]
MNVTPTEAVTPSAGLTGRQLFTRIWKYALRRVLFPLCVLAPLALLFPKIMLFYAICGAYDVSRNRPLTAETLRRYFLGNGVGTWLVSPFNCLLDLLSLPYVNKGVYQLADLPPAHQDEIKRLIQAANDADLVRQLQERSKENQRTMFFFRWYGANIETSLNVPAFHRPWKYVKTIGVSVFNRRVTTSKHFGYMRASLRVLYNLNDMKDNSAYIVVGGTTSCWRENKLFIFDDTLLHLSVNETEEPRYCLFVDIIRPSPFPAVMSGVVATVRYLTRNVKFIYYGNWKIIK